MPAIKHRKLILCCNIEFNPQIKRFYVLHFESLRV
jgi:hypothetical protein